MLKENIEILGARKYDYFKESTGEKFSGTKVYIDLINNDYGEVLGRSVKVLDYKDNQKIYDELQEKGLERGNTINGTAVYGRDYQSEKLVFMKIEF